MRVKSLFCLLIAFFLCGVFAHSHHDTEVEEDWWESLVEFDHSLGEYFSKPFDINSWSISGNMASFLQILPVKRITLPVIVNLLFDGFDGYGNEILALNEEQFEPWFAHVEHIMPHMIVPVGEEQTTSLKNPTKDSKIFYGFHLNLVKLSPLFNTILQDQIYLNLRPETPTMKANSTGMTEDEVLVDFVPGEESIDYYVDADRMSSFLQAASKGLGLQDSYNMFLLNPASSVDKNKGERYGYRSGFSQAEIDELAEVWGKEMEDIDSFLELLDIEATPFLNEEPMPLPEFLLPQLNQTRVQLLDYTSLSTDWAKWFLGKHSDQRKESFAKVKDDPSLLLNFAGRDSKTTIELAESIAASGTEAERDYLYRILFSSGKHVQANCLVDNWVSSGRTFFIDLTAGPFSWGPTLSLSDGLRTHNTIPRIPKYQQPDLKDEKEMEHTAEDAIEFLTERIHKAKQVYSLNCEGTATTNKHCQDLAQQVESWKSRHSMLLEQVKDEVKGSEEEGEDADWIMDNFLSRLSSVISSSIRQVLVPGSPLFRTKYSQKIVYHFYMISSHSNYDPRGEDGFEFELFKSEMKKLSFASQEVSFVSHQLSMSDSVDISTAFHSAKRTVLLPTVSDDGKYTNSEVHYVDSITLRDSLSELQKTIISGKYQSELIRAIPILFFSLDYRHPILVDKYYQAKALEDMVIIVQNAQEKYPSRIACNNDVIMLNLRNPIKAALSATSLLAGGIIPSHISYSEAHQSAKQDWLWSVGDQPWSFTSHGYEINRLQIDTARRNMIIHELTETIETVNRAVGIFHHIRVDTTNERIASEIDILRIVNEYNDVIEQWKGVCKAIAALHFDEALHKVKWAHHQANVFFTSAIDVDLTMSAFKCLPHAVEDVDTESQLILVIPFLFFVFDILLLIVVLVCRGSKKSMKAKIN